MSDASSDLMSWDRKYYEPGGGDAQLFYAVFGDFQEELKVSGSQYRSRGLPGGVDLVLYRRSDNTEHIESFFDGYLGRSLNENQPQLAGQVRRAPTCVELRGRVPDPETLDYLRDTVGLLTGLMDSGGVGMLDLLTLRWWEPPKWRQEIFEPDGPVPRHHVSILVSEEERADRYGNANWVHTRGLRKFGRPDLSIHHVRAEYMEAVIDLCNRFIEMLAFGHMIPEDQEIRMASLPVGLTCHHGGDLDDPDFNNVHIEIRWPK